MFTCCFSTKWNSACSDRRSILWSGSSKRRLTGVEFIPERLPQKGKEIFRGTECEDHGTKTVYGAATAGSAVDDFVNNTALISVLVRNMNITDVCMCICGYWCFGIDSHFRRSGTELLI